MSNLAVVDCFPARREWTFEEGNKLFDLCPFVNKTPPHRAVSGPKHCCLCSFLLPEMMSMIYEQVHENQSEDEGWNHDDSDGLSSWVCLQPPLVMLSRSLSKRTMRERRACTRMKKKPMSKGRGESNRLKGNETAMRQTMLEELSRKTTTIVTSYFQSNVCKLMVCTTPTHILERASGALVIGV